MKKLITKSCEEIMTTVYQPTVFAVDGLLAQGLFILAGSPKVGKSWLALTRQGARWVFADEHEDKPPDLFAFAVHDLMVKCEQMSVTATELSAELKKLFGLELPSNMVSKKLMQHGVELQGLGVLFEIKRSHGRRWLELSYDRSGDGRKQRMSGDFGSPHSRARRWVFCQSQHRLWLSYYVLRSALGKKIVVADGLDEVVRQALCDIYGRLGEIIREVKQCR